MSNDTLIDDKKTEFNINWEFYLHADIISYKIINSFHLSNSTPRQYLNKYIDIKIRGLKIS